MSQVYHFKIMKKIILLLGIVLWGLCVNAQYPKRDTILHNQFRDYVEWSKQQHKKTLEDFENTEKYQMIYFDKAIIDRKHHRIYLYSSYDLNWAEELGAGWQITIPHKNLKRELNNRKKLKEHKW